MKTTDFVKTEKHQFYAEPCHGGKGAWYFRNCIPAIKTEEAVVQFIHDDILPPGTSFGVHEHSALDHELFEEWYICISGQGIMTLDGKTYPFGEGDIHVCRGGGSHGVENTGTADMRLLVIAAKAKK